MKSLQLSFDYCVHSKKEIEGNRTYLYEEGETFLTFNISLNDNFNFQSWCKILYLRSFGFGCLESHGFVGGGRIIYTTVVGFVNRAFPQPLSRDDAAQAERRRRERRSAPNWEPDNCYNFPAIDRRAEWNLFSSAATRLPDQRRLLHSSTIRRTITGIPRIRGTRIQRVS